MINMSNFWKALKAGLKATTAEFKPGNYKIEGKTVQCPHCGNDKFAEGSGQLNSAGMTFLNLDWANKSASTLACSKCGRIEWFLQKPIRIKNFST